MDGSFKNIGIILGSVFIGGIITAIVGFFTEKIVEDILLEWRMLGVVGAIVGTVMGICTVVKKEGIGSYMTDQQVLGATVYQYRHKIIEENYFDYIFFFAAFALFVVDLWAYNPAFESGTFSSDILCLALAFGNVSAMSLLILKLSSWLGQ